MIKSIKRLESKIKTLFWFAKRPSHWPYAIELIKRNIFNKNQSLINNQNHDSLIWCEKKCVNIEQALNELGIMEKGLIINKIDGNIIEKGREKIKAAGVIMGGEADINLLFNIVSITKSQKIIETGVAFGWSSMAILLAQKNIPNSYLYSIDMPYPKDNNESYVGLVIPEDLKSNWKLIREPDRNGLKKVLSRIEGNIDMFHYDSDKSYEGRKYSYNLIWPKLKKGGILISDDIEDNSYFMKFTKEKNVRFSVINSNNKYVGIIIK
jgi:predicted O-methyltransferase YrrM